MRLCVPKGAAREFEIPEMSPALAKAYLSARRPGSAAVDVTVVLDGSKVVHHGPPNTWAKGVARRIERGELQLGIVRILRAGYQGALPIGSGGAAVSDPGDVLVVPAPGKRVSRSLPSSSLAKILSRALKVGISMDPGGCAHMEDTVLVHAPTASGFAFCGVFDGHGGSHASLFCKEHLHFNVMASAAFGRGDVTAALLDGFRKTEADLINEQCDASRAQGKCSAGSTGHRGSVEGAIERAGGSCTDGTAGVLGTPSSATSNSSGCCGSTALLMLLYAECMHLAWLGDCRAVLCNQGRAVQLTVDHSLKDAHERARALSEGGVVDGNRLGGFLEVARALGDYDVTQGRKPAGLSALPEIRSRPVNDEDEFVILGSDGLWGVVQPDDAVRLARAELAAYDGDATMASEKLVEVALKRHADDNVSAMVVCLNLPTRDVEQPRRPRLMLSRRAPAVKAPIAGAAATIATAAASSPPPEGPAGAVPAESVGRLDRLGSASQVHGQERACTEAAQSPA